MNAHPEKLDPAINNRPGRFDVVIEVPSPDWSLRLKFFQRKLSDVNSEVLERLAESTEGLSFAHLQEILRFSGLLAIKAGRRARTDDDLTEAVEMVRRGHEDARGFAAKPEMPCGLAALHRKSRRVLSPIIFESALSFKRDRGAYAEAHHATEVRPPAPP